MPFGVRPALSDHVGKAIARQSWPSASSGVVPIMRGAAELEKLALVWVLPERTTDLQNSDYVVDDLRCVRRTSSCCGDRTTATAILARLALMLINQPSLDIPDLKAFIVQPHCSPVTRGDSHRHPLIRRDGLAATVTGEPDAQPMAKLDQLVSWKAALLNSLFDELTTEAGVHRAEKQGATAVLPEEIERIPYSAHGVLTCRTWGAREHVAVRRVELIEGSTRPDA